MVDTPKKSGQISDDAQTIDLNDPDAAYKAQVAADWKRINTPEGKAEAEKEWKKMEDSMTPLERECANWGIDYPALMRQRQMEALNTPGMHTEGVNAAGARANGDKLGKDGQSAMEQRTEDYLNRPLSDEEKKGHEYHHIYNDGSEKAKAGSAQHREKAGNGAGKTESPDKLESNKTLEEGLRKAGLYDVKERFHVDGQEDGKLGRGATQAYDEFIKQIQEKNGLTGESGEKLKADTIKAIENMAGDHTKGDTNKGPAEGISVEFMLALKEKLQDGSMQALNEKYGMKDPVHVGSGEMVAAGGGGAKQHSAKGQGQG